jgi:hypothetical protein
MPEDEKEEEEEEIKNKFVSKLQKTFVFRVE